MTSLGRRTRTASPAPVAAVPDVELPDVSFVTVTYGTGAIVVDMITSLVDSLADGPLTYEVVVVDNEHPVRSGTSATELSLFTHGVWLVSPGTNLGFGGGCELGALHARGSILAFVNPDTQFESGWIEPLVARLERPHAPSIVAPALFDADGTVQESGQFVDAAGHTHPNTDLEVTDVDYASAACWLMTRAEHERLGGFDPAYHPAYFEDVDLALRASELGRGTAVEPASRVVHRRGHGTPDRPRPATAQHAELLRRWPALAWRQPRPLD